MKLKMRFEDTVQIIELDENEVDQLWISLSLEGDDLPQNEKEEKIQDAIDEQYNKPEYNVWHRETRHIDPNPKCKRMDGKKGYIQGEVDDPAFDIMDYLLITSDDETIDSGFDYESICSWIRTVLSKKPAWADAFIAVRMNGEPIRDYAARTGNDENNISQKLKRATKKLQENFRNRQI